MAMEPADGRSAVELLRMRANLNVGRQDRATGRSPARRRARGWSSVDAGGDMVNPVMRRPGAFAHGRAFIRGARVRRRDRGHVAAVARTPPLRRRARGRECAAYFQDAERALPAARQREVDDVAGPRAEQRLPDRRS